MQVWKFMLVAGAAIAAFTTASAKAEDHEDPLSLGKAIYTRDCSLCHDNSPHMLNDTGPALYGVVGRQVGSLSGFSYSPALTAARDHGDHWSSDRLDAFLTNPEAMYPGTGMPMNFEDPRMRHAVIAYLQTLKATD